WPECIWSCRGGSIPGASTFFRMFVASAAQSLILTSVRTPAIDYLQGLTNYQFSLSPPADVPVFLSTSLIGLSPRLSNIRKILGPTGRLGMLEEGTGGEQLDDEVE